MSEEREMLAAAVDRLFAENLDAAAVVAAETVGVSEELRKQVLEMGLSQPHAIAEKGEGWRHAAVILRAVGRHAVPLPLAEGILARWLGSRAGIEVPQGTLTLAPVTLAEGTLDGERFSAEVRGVPWGSSSDFVLLAAESRGGLRVAFASCGKAESFQGETIAGEPRDRMRFLDVPCGEFGDLALAPDVPNSLLAAARAAQMAGALEAILAIAVEYAGEREQFGRPIARFQAVQQELARLAGQVAAAGVAAEAAFRALDERAGIFEGRIDAEADPTFEIACAKVVAGEASELGPRIAHQVLGAIGFTHEHRLHLFTRRLWAWRAEYGTVSQWAVRLGRLGLAESEEGIWPVITSR